MAWAHCNRWLAAAAILFTVTGATGAVTGDSAVINNSGSTNTLGYRIEVRTDGSATVAMVHGPGASPSPQKAFSVSAATVKQFFSDLAAAREAKSVTEPCMKSASFGSSTYVTWQGWRSADLTCPPSDAQGKALVGDVEQIRTAAGVSANPLRQGPVQVKPPAAP
ncbi:MAG TPA: hypothetical protein VHX17_08200 [Candidatus Cybelea sp.]|jgi:hypothetical protein|nr:hypothetical protein [Candidatus Cybelea sp.]